MTRLAAKVLVVSDSVATGERNDATGPAVETVLEEAGFTVVDRGVLPDEEILVSRALISLAEGFVGLIVTAGGTGLGPRDVTPEATAAVIDREAPGLAEAMRAVDHSGVLSRGRSGCIGQALVMNLPGSPPQATEHMRAVLDLLPHALGLLAGERLH